MKQLCVKIFASLLFTLSAGQAFSQGAIPENAVNKKWWKEAVVYQVYPRSFKDSDGDGVGDLKGIISKLDYIQSLGIDVVWLNPIYSSPNDDNGYDISDYRSIMKDFGTMDDFNVLLKGLHDRKIKLVMDLVVNHSSDEHEWFRQSRSSRTNPYRDYYHWWPAEKGVPAKRWSFFDEDASAWRLDSTTNSYYLHYFSRKQPDLNWENPKLRQEVYGLMKFWFDKGIDGFRMDVIPFVSKDTAFPPLPAEYNAPARIDYDPNYIEYYARGPHLHEYMQEMNREVLSKYDVMTVGEGIGVRADEALLLVDKARKELNMFFTFETAAVGKDRTDWSPDAEKFKLTDFKTTFSKWINVFKEKGWATVYLGNHDQSRMVSRFGNDKPEYRETSSKMLYTFLLSQRATVYVYAGDEIGMTNIRFKDIKDYRDLQTINHYNLLKRQGKPTDDFLRDEAEFSRENGRTPMQWTGGQNAGFTTGTPWLKINPDHITVNVEAAEKEKNGILSYFRKMIKLRKQLPELVYGNYTVVDKDNPQVFAYTRTLKDKKVLVLLSFSTKVADFTVTPEIGKMGNILINNLPGIATDGNTIHLKPYQAMILRLE
ncbi:MAG: alpha-glucosidase [Mucilaginibacter sp.]